MTLTPTLEDLRFLKGLSVGWNTPVPVVDGERYQRVTDDNDRLTSMLHQARNENLTQRDTIFGLMAENDALKSENKSLRQDRASLVILLAGLAVAAGILLLTGAVRVA